MTDGRDRITHIAISAFDAEPQLINTNALPFRKGLEDCTDRHLQANLKIHNLPVAADSQVDRARWWPLRIQRTGQHGLNRRLVAFT